MRKPETTYLSTKKVCFVLFCFVLFLFVLFVIYYHDYSNRIFTSVSAAEAHEDGVVGAKRCTNIARNCSICWGVGSSCNVLATIKANSANARGGECTGAASCVSGIDGSGVPVDGACVPLPLPPFLLFRRCFRVTRFFCDFFDLLFLI